MIRPAPMADGTLAALAKREKTAKQHIELAAEALSDLNTFYIVISTMEGGHLHSPSYKAAARIINICREVGGKLLANYDRHVAAALRARAADGGR